MSKNDITGDEIKTKGVSKAYEDNFERIFGKKNIAEGKAEALKNAEECFRNKPKTNQPLERPKYCFKLCRKPDCVCVPDWDEKRIDTIGQNGNTGDHYGDVYDKVENDYKDKF